jgi:hypothetical protein
MKKAIMIMVIMIIVSVTIGTYAEQYPTTMIVNELDYNENIVICIDFNGNEWAFEEIEDWCIGDIASMIMDDMGTESIYDDTIIMVRYSGYMEGF